MSRIFAPALAATVLCTTMIAPEPASAASTWVTTPLPTTVPATATFSAVAAGSTTLAWAAGSTPLRPLLLHWNGRSWVEDTIPGSPAAGAMNEVSSASPHTAWSAGYTSPSGTPLILRWVGGHWAEVPVPANVTDNALEAIADGGQDTGWVVAHNSAQGYLLDHWSDGLWSSVNIPSQYSDTANSVVSLIAKGPDDVWVATAGNYFAGISGALLHYRAGVWSSIPAPTPGFTLIGGLLPISASDLWIDGTQCTVYQPPQGCTATQPLIAHWNGRSWDSQANPTGVNSDIGLAAGKTGQPRWAGASAGNSPPLYVRHAGTGWTVVTGGTLVPNPSYSGTLVSGVPDSNAAWAVATSSGSTTASVIQYNAG